MAVGARPGDCSAVAPGGVLLGGAPAVRVTARACADTRHSARVGARAATLHAARHAPASARAAGLSVRMAPRVADASSGVFGVGVGARRALRAPPGSLGLDGRSPASASPRRCPAPRRAAPHAGDGEPGGDEVGGGAPGGSAAEAPPPPTPDNKVQKWWRPVLAFCVTAAVLFVSLHVPLVREACTKVVRTLCTQWEAPFSLAVPAVLGLLLRVWSYGGRLDSAQAGAEQREQRVLAGAQAREQRVLADAQAREQRSREQLQELKEQLQQLEQRFLKDAQEREQRAKTDAERTLAAIQAVTAALNASEARTEQRIVKAEEHTEQRIVKAEEHTEQRIVQAEARAAAIAQAALAASAARSVS
jgi:hypothetical protein